jgi:hypothetical protein
LDDTPDKSNSKNYTPPESLTVYLSKIAMPELQPQAKVPPPPAVVSETKPVETKKESKKEQKEREKAKRKEDKKGRGK